MKYNIQILVGQKNLIDALLEVKDEPHGVTLTLKWGQNSLIQKENTFPFICLKEVRLELERSDIKLCVKGSRRDVHPSGGMLAGFGAYLLKMGERASDKDIIRIFDIEHNTEYLSTVEEQELYYKEWLQSF